MMDNYNAFIKVIKKDPRVQNKINVMLDRYMSLPFDFQSKIGYNSLIQNVILKEPIKYNVTNDNRFRYRIKNEKRTTQIFVSF